MELKKGWYYERLTDEGKLEHAPMNDLDGKVTGRLVYGLKAWFDEHPEERKALGWTKHIYYDTKDMEYNRQTQFLVTTVRAVDEWTVEEEYRILDKSEEMMRLDELLNRSGRGWIEGDSGFDSLLFGEEA